MAPEPSESAFGEKFGTGRRYHLVERLTAGRRGSVKPEAFWRDKEYMPAPILKNLRAQASMAIRNCDFEDETYDAPLEEGEVLFRQGDPADALYVVVDGAVVPIAEEGAPKKLAIFEAGAFFGRMRTPLGQAGHGGSIL